MFEAADAGIELIICITEGVPVQDMMKVRNYLDQKGVREEALRNRLEVSAYQGIFGVWVRFESLQISDGSVYDPYGVAEDRTLPSGMASTSKWLSLVTSESFSMGKGVTRFLIKGISSSNNP